MKAPYKVIFSNDTTNIGTCASPYHKKGERWKPEMLEATVDEVAGTGVDAHFIQLCTGQVPWYQSKVYPLQEHHRWWQQHFGVEPDHPAFDLGGVHRFILDGGDPLQVFIDRCRRTGQAPFVSMRMNDAHLLENVNTPGNFAGLHCISRFYAEHPEWRIGDNPQDWHTRVLNWAVPEVREWIFSLLEEQIRNYDIDGFELDLQRHCNLFRQDETTRRQRAEIMTDFVRRVRGVLDETSPGKHRWLCARIPCYTAAFDPLGIDLPAWSRAGLDMVNVSPHYFTVQQTDLAEIRGMVPEASVYLEMCHATWNGARLTEKGYDNFTFRRTTPEQYQTAAHLAYSQGADGVSAFNFVYYREHGVGERGPFNEPPFDVFNHLGDPGWLAAQPQHWFVAPGWNCPYGGVRVPMPRALKSGEATSLELELAPPAGGWKAGGRLRIQAEEDLDAGEWAATINGVSLADTDDRSEPYPNPYPPLLGTRERLRAWQVPPDAPKHGSNTLTLSMKNGAKPAKLVFIDLRLE
jgi:hypothetical protein